MNADPSRGELVAQALRARRTVNFFTQERVPEEVLEEAVRVARWAPNHRLTEPWQFFHLGPQTRAAVIDLAVAGVVASKGQEAGVARRERLAAVPDWLVVTSSKSSDALLQREDYAATCCAVQNLMVYLSSVGVGSKWTTGPVTRDPALPALLGLNTEQHEVVGIFWLGYARQAPESRRGDVKEVFHRLD